MSTSSSTAAGAGTPATTGPAYSGALQRCEANGTPRNNCTAALAIGGAYNTVLQCIALTPTAQCLSDYGTAVQRVSVPGVAKRDVDDLLADLTTDIGLPAGWSGPPSSTITHDIRAITAELGVQFDEALSSAMSAPSGPALVAPVINPGDAVTPCMQEVASVQTAVDTYRNTPPPRGDAIGDPPGAVPTIAQLVSSGFLSSAPTACRSMTVDAAGVARAITPEGVAIP